jgi:hypothetical protein
MSTLPGPLSPNRMQSRAEPLQIMKLWNEAAERGFRGDAQDDYVFKSMEND